MKSFISSYFMPKSPAIKKVARAIKRDILTMSYKSKTGHIGSALSISDILTVLYFKVMNIDPKKPKASGRDRFILSKGHGAAALYATLAERGFFPIKYLEGYRVNKGRFHGHPCTTASKGIEVSTGSLGHGLSIGAGMALALENSEPKSHVYVLIGDGECNEGSIWEAAMFVATHDLNNLTVIIDNNKFQGFGASKDVVRMNLKQKWQVFGWEVFTCDGHNLTALEKNIRTAKKSSKPAIVIAETISGKGVDNIENSLRAHYATLDEITYQTAMKKI